MSLGHFANWFCHVFIIDECAGEMFFFFFGTLHLSSSQRIWDRFVFQCVNVYSICVIDILVAFCKL